MLRLRRCLASIRHVENVQYNTSRTRFETKMQPQMVAQDDVYRVLSEMHSSVTGKSPLVRGEQDLGAVFVEEIQTFSYNLKDKLLLLTVVKRLFTNSDFYFKFCEKLVERGLFTYMMETISRTENLYLLYSCKETITAVLMSSVAVKERHSFITLLCDTWCKKNTTSSKVTVAEICRQLLSSKFRLACKTGIEVDILRQFSSSWPDLVKDTLRLCQKNPTASENYIYMINSFLKLWKKVIKALHRSEDVNESLCVYITSVDILLEELHRIPDDYCGCFIEVLDAVFCQTNRNLPIQNSVTRLAHTLLCLDTPVIVKLMDLKTTKGFLGCRNIEKGCDNDCNDKQRHTMAASTVLKKYIRCCCLISCPSAAATEKLDTVVTMYQCLDTMTLYFKKPLHYVVVDCFGDQDDDYFQVSLDLLMIYLKFQQFQRQAEESSLETSCIIMEDICKNLNPHQTFLLFSQNTNWDTSLLLDFIISPETCFLEYFMHYLKLLTGGDWDFFVRTCKQFTHTLRVLGQHSPHPSTEFLQPTQSEVLGASEDPMDYIPPSHYNTSHSPNGQSSLTVRAVATMCRDNEGISTDQDVPCVQSNYLSPKKESSELCVVFPLVNYSDSSDGEESCISISETRENLTESPYKQEDFTEKPGTGGNIKYDTKKSLVMEGDGSDQGYHCSDVLENFMSSLIRLRLKLERMHQYDLLTFNIVPLTELIKKCELLYEK